MGRKIAAGNTPVKTEVNTGFKPLKAGRYEATIFGLEEGKYTTAKNKGLDKLNVQYRISEGQVGTNRRLFDEFPLAPTWLDGSDAFRFHQFGAAVTDRTEEEFRAYAAAQQEAKEDIELPDDADLLGYPVTITVAVQDDKYRFDEAVKKWKAEGEVGDMPKQADFQRNRITNVSPAGGGNAPAAGTAEAEVRPKAETLDL